MTLKTQGHGPIFISRHGDSKYPQDKPRTYTHRGHGAAAGQRDAAAGHGHRGSSAPNGARSKSTRGGSGR